MKKDTIIQFVGFATQLEFSEFAPKWEDYARQLVKVSGARILHSETKNKNGIRYLSQHEFRETSFRFNFMKGRNSEHFPEQHVRVSQLGGYLPVQIQSRRNEIKNYTKVIAFVSHAERDIEFYQQLSNYSLLDIYQAYYESCVYGHILEFLCTGTDAPLLLEQLRSSTYNESAVYKDCKTAKQKPSLHYS